MMDFSTCFKALTGNPPFPWQESLYRDWFVNGDIPDCCDLPTGLGKTSVLAIWLLALAAGGKLPRRLVYVVNRRTVVDQTTTEAEKLCKNLALSELAEVENQLRKLCALEDTLDELPLAISTLRGQYADNREWSTNPARPAIVCGTVDMIGSRLLFSGYGVGFKSRPLHAGFLGQDALLIHDEAHLEPAFQRLLIAIEEEQKRCGDFRPLRVMELSATSRGGKRVFNLTKREMDGKVPVVRDRLMAKKGLTFECVPRASVAGKIAELALRHRESGKKVVVFVRTIEDVMAISNALESKKEGVGASHVRVLTGTMRGKERDDLAERDSVFARFLPEPPKGVEPAKGTVYLVCTSAGEVGVDISADHMVCDLTTLDAMAQRLGRVNRRGGGAAEVDVVYESDPDPKRKEQPFEQARWATLPLLQALPACDWIDDRVEASPLKIGALISGLDKEQRKASFFPEPGYVETQDIYFDAWALTSIRGVLPGRPIVAPFLHGIEEAQLPETQVAWREEVGVIVPWEEELLNRYPPTELLRDYPLKPRELLRDRSDRIFKQLEILAKRSPRVAVWVVDDEGEVNVHTLDWLTAKENKEVLYGQTLVLPPATGGLTASGMFDGNQPTASDVSGWLSAEDNEDLIELLEPMEVARTREWRERDARRSKATAGMRLVRTIEVAKDDDEPHLWEWFEALPLEGGSSALGDVEWKVHVGDVVRYTEQMLRGLGLPEDIASAILLAAKYHDHGKRRERFQRTLGNESYPALILAKSGHKLGRQERGVRHEFGSMIDILEEKEVGEFKALSEELKDLVLHLIAAHHGRARPHFEIDEALDLEHDPKKCRAMSAETARRFARLQRRYGRWGLAYLESILRAADWAASAKPSKILAAEPVA